MVFCDKLCTYRYVFATKIFIVRFLIVSNNYYLSFFLINDWPPTVFFLYPGYQYQSVKVDLLSCVVKSQAGNDHFLFEIFYFLNQSEASPTR